MERSRSAHKERIVRGHVHSEHVVQFFDTIESLAATVSAFLDEGLKHAGNVLVVARARNWDAVRSRLIVRGLDVHRAIEKGRVRLLDADEVLAQILRGGLVDSVLFHNVIGGCIRTLANKPGQLRIYGELVELLAEEGNFYAAQRLEELWNELAVRQPLILLCGYSAAHFTPRSARDALESICRTHTHVQRSSADAMAEWLLTDSRATARTSLPS